MRPKSKLIKKTSRVELHKISDSNYEVVVMQKQRKSIYVKETLSGYIKYPSTSQWGEYGFTFIKLENAINKFDKLVEKYKISKL